MGILGPAGTLKAGSDYFPAVCDKVTKGCPMQQPQGPSESSKMACLQPS